MLNNFNILSEKLIVSDSFQILPFSVSNLKKIASYSYLEFSYLKNGSFGNPIFLRAMTISRIFEMYGNLSMTSLLLTHTEICIHTCNMRIMRATSDFLVVNFKHRNILIQGWAIVARYWTLFLVKLISIFEFNISVTQQDTYTQSLLIKNGDKWPTLGVP